MPRTALVDIDGRTAEIEVPDGVDPQTYLVHATETIRASTRQSGQNPEADTSKNLLNEPVRVAKSYGSEISQGLKQAFAPQYGEPNAFDRGVGAVFGPAGAEASQKYISTPVSQVTGLLRALFPMVGTLANEADVGVNRAARFAGAPQEVADVAGKTAGAAMGTVAPLGGGPVQLVQQLMRALSNPVAKSLRTAEEANRSNAISNANIDIRNEAALNQFLDQLAGQTAQKQSVADANRMANRQAVQGEAGTGAALNRAESQLAQYGPNREIVSPAAQRLQAPATNVEAYAFMNNPATIMPKVPLGNLESAADEILQMRKGVPPSVAPGGVKPGKVAGELADTEAFASGKPQLTRGQLEGAGFGSQGNFSDDAWAKIQSQLETSRTGGGLTLDKVDQIKQGLGELTHSPNSATSGLAKKMYYNLFEDLRTAAKSDPIAAQYLEANRTALQNFTARDIADIVTYNGTRADKLGRLQVDPGKIMKMINEKDLLKNLPADQASAFLQTIEDVYRTRSQATKAGELLPEIVPATKVKGLKLESRLSENIQPNMPPTRLEHWNPVRLAAGAAGGTIAHAMGIPPFLGAMGGYAAAAAYPRLIFTAAMTPAGRAFLHTLYKDTPPMVNDAAKIIAISNFLKSQGSMP